MEDKYLPSSRTAVHVDTSGAIIVEDTDTDDDDERDETARVEAAVFGHHHHAPSSAASSTTTNGSNGIPSASADTPGGRDSHDIYLPKHTEWISHVAIDIGGSLAKVVYFSRAPTPPTPNGNGSTITNGRGKGKGKELLLDGYAHHDPAARVPFRSPNISRPASPGRTTPIPNGVLGPESIASSSSIKSYFERHPGSQSSLSQSTSEAASSSSSSSPSPSSPGDGATPSISTGTSLPPNAVNGTQTIRGGYLNFTKFETGDIASCIEFINYLIESSAASHQIPVAEFKTKHVKIMATGGGAHLFYDRLSEDLGVEVRKEEEMECLIAGLTFFMEIPHEVFWYSDQLVHSISHPAAKCSLLHDHLAAGEQQQHQEEDLPRPSPNPPQYSLVFDEHPSPQFPCMLVNIGSGVSIIKVDGDGKYERISGTSLGGGTLWGLLSLLTGADTFDEMLALSEKGDNSNVDMLVGDIYGSDYSKIGLKSSTIASTFGKVFRKGQRGKKFNPEDIARSLLYAISNNIGQIAYMNAEKHNLDRIYFGGCFIRGHSATISTLSYAIRFWSKGTKRALFLRHEGYLGAIGAWLRNIEEEDTRRA